jgi:UDP-N-acetylglucosamine:LPS N-acetylglucosamine transferase
MKKIMFSVTVGSSVAHVLRTRTVARNLLKKGYDVLYSTSHKALPFLKDYLGEQNIAINNTSAESSTSYIDKIDYVTLANNEHKIYQNYQPDIIIGDNGLICHLYQPDVPFISILNRFEVELLGHGDSPFDFHELTLMRNQLETLVNSIRKKRQLLTPFTYSDYASPPAIINGASFLVNDLQNYSYYFAGSNTALQVREKKYSHYENSLLFFGTGLRETRLDLISKVLKKIENRFKKIYVSYGTKLNIKNIYQPSNAIMQPLFDFFPDDVGLLICHGGYGILDSGVWAGVPIIMLPFSPEHLSNSYQIEKQGLGFNLGIYDKNNFQGRSEQIQVNWSQFENALDNFHQLKPYHNITELASKGSRLNTIVEDFINQHTSSYTG